MKTNSAIKRINFSAITIAAVEVYFKISDGHILKQKSVIWFESWCEKSMNPKE
jgi:hypothetical protein